MNPEQFTHKTNEILLASRSLAEENGHPQITPVHLSLALLDDNEGLLKQAVKASSENNPSAVEALEKSLHTLLRKVPKQTPPPDDVTVNAGMIKILKKAQWNQRKRGDSYLAVDQLLLASLEDPQIVDVFKNAGLNLADIKTKLESFRGTRKVESEHGDNNFQVLTI